MSEAYERNKRVAKRIDDLMAQGRHGFYESAFRVVREEVEFDQPDSTRAMSRRRLSAQASDSPSIRASCATKAR